MYILSFVNQKGGVGKTTLAMNTAARLGLSGARVLLVDMDPQCSLTYLAGANRPKATLWEVLAGPLPPGAAVVKGPECDILPGSPQLSLLETRLSGPDKGLGLKKALEEVRDHYDFAIIDSPPALGLLMLNVLCASQSVVIPALADVFSLQGIGQLYATIRAVRQGPNPQLGVEGILLSREAEATALETDMERMLRATARKMGTQLFDAFIRRDPLVCQAQAARQSIFRYAPQSAQAADYSLFTLEYLKRLRQRLSHK